MRREHPAFGDAASFSENSTFTDTVLTRVAGTCPLKPTVGVGPGRCFQQGAPQRRRVWPSPLQAAAPAPRSSPPHPAHAPQGVSRAHQIASFQWAARSKENTFPYARTWRNIARTRVGLAVNFRVWRESHLGSVVGCDRRQALSAQRPSAPHASRVRHVPGTSHSSPLQNATHPDARL